MQNRNSIGKQIRKCRKQNNLKQEKLAEIVELSPNYLSAIERGVKLPKLETFVRIANALNVTSDALLADVLKTGNLIKSNQLYDIICKLPDDEQKRIFNVIETMVNNI